MIIITRLGYQCGSLAVRGQVPTSTSVRVPTPSQVPTQGIVSKGAVDYACKILSHAHLLASKVKGQIGTERERVLNISSELAQGFWPNLGIRKFPIVF